MSTFPEPGFYCSLDSCAKPELEIEAITTNNKLIRVAIVGNTH